MMAMAFPDSENQREKALAFPLSTSGNKQRTMMGLGAFPALSLADARGLERITLPC
jgi:hypothetical protein